MKLLTGSYRNNISELERELRYAESFDMIEKKMTVAKLEISFFYIDGFVKDGALQRIMQFLLSQKSLTTAKETEAIIPYIETRRESGIEAIATAVLSGETAFLSESFGGEAIILDLRTYPTRSITEP